MWCSPPSKNAVAARRCVTTSATSASGASAASCSRSRQAAATAAPRQRGRMPLRVGQPAEERLQRRPQPLGRLHRGRGPREEQVVGRDAVEPEVGQAGAHGAGVRQRRLALPRRRRAMPAECGEADVAVARCEPEAAWCFAQHTAGVALRGSERAARSPRPRLSATGKRSTVTSASLCSWASAAASSPSSLSTSSSSTSSAAPVSASAAASASARCRPPSRFISRAGCGST